MDRAGNMADEREKGILFTAIDSGLQARSDRSDSPDMTAGIGSRGGGGAEKFMGNSW